MLTCEAYNSITALTVQSTVSDHENDDLMCKMNHVYGHFKGNLS